MSSPDVDRLTTLLRELEKTCEKAKELREQLAAYKQVGAFHPELDRVNKLIAERFSTTLFSTSSAADDVNDN
ncbi:MAG TPA: hypothetical protein VN654_04365 [Vicinamibacterales bacterium]|jgi:hypothetical protein|nr:hypothetical protein [Vicinamibacterales bacterium]